MIISWHKDLDEKLLLSYLQNIKLHMLFVSNGKKEDIKIPERNNITERNLSGKSSQFIYYCVYVYINWLIYISNFSSNILCNDTSWILTLGCFQYKKSSALVFMTETLFSRGLIFFLLDSETKSHKKNKFINYDLSI